jgi:predicted acylesterase/phospholipase RssA
LPTLLDASPQLATNLQIVWMLQPEERVAPKVERRWAVEHRDIMVELSGDLAHPSGRQWQGMQRLVRHLQGIKIGLALGGGGARGLAHLGVFRAMDEAKLSFDLLSGTSSGAMMGVGYCAGYSCAEGIVNFPSELTPSAMFQKVPGGKAWYLWFNYRTGRFDGKLRKFFYDWQFEQLPVPCITMSADLFTGQAIGRESGDLVHAVLESINLPMISSPIFRDEMALVDGGILNNLPADKLVEHGTDLVIGVNVVAKLKHAFAGMRPGDPLRRRRPGHMETLMRVTEVQGHGINAIRSGSVDLLVEPDTSPFEFADFTKAAPLADAGHEAMAKVVPQIQQMIRDLEQWPV